MSLSIQKIKLIKSLKLKKYRQKYNFFVAEGQNIAKELAKDKGKYYELIEAYYCKAESARYFKNCPSSLITEKEMKKISFLKNPSDCIMILSHREEKKAEKLSGLNFYCAGIQDPGNLGTIIRIANWFGAASVIRSKDTADFYNPKVIQATMGAFLGVSLLEDNNCLQSIDIEKVALDMNGESIYEAQFKKDTICIIGNEGAGLTKEQKFLADRIISIPAASKTPSVDSLNAAVSVGIFAASFNRSTL